MPLYTQNGDALANGAYISPEKMAPNDILKLGLTDCSDIKAALQLEMNENAS